MRPTIVISTYNRLNSLKRLLRSLKKSNYKTYNPKLIISVDYDSDSHRETHIYLESFEWVNQHYELIKHPKNLGLKKHFEYCLGLSIDEGSVIFLEDDFIVSPDFYIYAVEATSFFSTDPKIAGVSLYSLGYNEFSNRPFYPIKDDSENFFAQIPTWGKIVTKNQWLDFQEWKKKKIKVDYNNYPKAMQKWSKKSFKREYIPYLVDQNKYYVLPFKSRLTNFGDSGTHFLGEDRKFQTPLTYTFNAPHHFNKLNHSNSVYDVFLEILPEKLKVLRPELKNYDFDVDLYGIKKSTNLAKRHVLTSKKIKQQSPLHSYGRKLIPQEINIFYNIPGSYFNLVEKGKIPLQRKKGFITYLKDALYDFPSVSVHKLIFIDLWKLATTIKDFLKKDSFKNLFR